MGNPEGGHNLRSSGPPQGWTFISPWQGTQSPSGLGYESNILVRLSLVSQALFQTRFIFNR